MHKDGIKPEESSSSFAAHDETATGATSPLPPYHSATGSLEFTAPVVLSRSAPYTPCSAGWAQRTRERYESCPLEESAIPEKAVRQTLIIVEEEPALVHTRHVPHGSGVADGHPGTAYSWSPSTPDFAELIPIGTTQSQRESVATHEIEVPSYTPYESSEGSPRADTAFSLSRTSTAPGVSPQNATVGRMMPSTSSYTRMNSTGTVSGQGTPASPVLLRCPAHTGEASCDAVNPLVDTHNTDAATLLHTSVPPFLSQWEFHRRATAAPTSLRPVSPKLERSPSPSAMAKDAAPEGPVFGSAPTGRSPMNLCVLVNHEDTDSLTPTCAPLSLHVTNTTKTNASGGAVPNVPAIRLPVSPSTPGIESDRSFNRMGYGPRNAPHACSLASTRSSRSFRSARHSHRGGASMRTTLPSLKKLFPTLPDEMYIARERLCVARDSSGHLGTGAYGIVQRAELYPPEMEVSRLFTPTTETFMNASNSTTPGCSPANPLLPSHNFDSIASAVGGVDGNAVTLSASAHGKEHSHVYLHSRLTSMISVDGVSTLPLHQQPYSDQTASFYNGLDSVPALLCAESPNDPHWPMRGQSPEVESVVVCEALVVHMDSAEVSTLATPSAMVQQGTQNSPSPGWLSVGPQERRASTPLTPLNSCCISQKFPDLSAVLATTRRDDSSGGFLPTSMPNSIEKADRDELDADLDASTVRMSAGEGGMHRVLAGPLDNSAVSEGAGFSLTSTVDTHRFSSPHSPLWTHKPYSRSSRTADGNVSGAGEGEDVGVGHSSHPADINATALPIQTLFEVDEAVVVSGSEDEECSIVSQRRTTKVHPAEVPCNAGRCDAALPTQPGAGVDAAQRNGGDVHGEAALRLPLVLPHGPCPNTFSTCDTVGGNPAEKGCGDARAASREDDQMAFVAVHGGGEVAAVEHFEAATEDERDANDNARRASRVCLLDRQEAPFLLNVTGPKSQGSLAQVGDDTLMHTAQQSVVQAVREGREEFEDVAGRLISGRQNRSEGSEAEGMDAAAKPAQVGSSEAEKDIDSDAEGGAAASAMRQVCKPNFLCSGAPTHTSTTTPGHSPAGGVTVTITTTNGEGKHVEPVSPVSTVSSLFSGGVTSLPTTRTSNQGGMGVAPHAGINSLPCPSNVPQTPLVRYGVNSSMVSEAVNNGCVPFRPVATKVVEKSDLAENPMKLNAFHNELRMASRLQHPCLVNMFGVAEDAENFYLVMDLAEKGDLARYQKQFGVEDTRLMAPRFLADVVLALEYLQDGSQHTYWMPSPTIEAAQQNNASGEENGNGDGHDAEKPDHHGSLSCPWSTSTLSLHSNADDYSSTFTPKPCPLLSVPGALLQRRIEGTDVEGDNNTVASTAVRAETKGDDVHACARSPTKAKEEKALMKESIVLHRDVKPENLLLTWDFHVKLADFGDACFYGDEEANSFGGTPSYISPEVIQTSKAGPCSDLWAMGCILYELLVGERLFQGSLREVAKSVEAFSSDDMTFPTAPTRLTGDSVQDIGFGDDEDSHAVLAHAPAECGDSSSSSSHDGGDGGISAAAKDLVRQLLRHVPEERIGSAERGGFPSLKRHPFFAEIDWDKVLETTNITTTNTDYTSELADYLEPGESVVYCSPVKVLPTGGEEPPVRLRPAHLGAQGLLVMVLTDTPRLFLVNPDSDTVQFWLPWSPELRVGVLRADCFTITVPINDLLTPSLLGPAFNSGASMSATSRNSASTAPTATYTFYDTTRRADLWGVKIHNLQSSCSSRREVGAPTPSSFQSSTMQPTGTSGVMQLHCPPSLATHRGTSTTLPKTGGCLLHRLRTTPRSARAGSISHHAVLFTEAAIATPRDGRSAVMHNVGSFTEVFSSHSVPSASASSPAIAGVPAAAKPMPMTRSSQPVRQRATSFSAYRTPALVPAVSANRKPATVFTSPSGVSLSASSIDLRSPEVSPTSQTAAATMGAVPAHHCVKRMTVTVASSSNPQSSRFVRPSSLGNIITESSTGVFPVSFGATTIDWWIRATEGTFPSSTANDSSLKSTRPCSNGTTTNWSTTTTRTGSANGSDMGWGSFCEETLGFSCSAGDVTPRAARAGDSEDGARAFATDTPTQSEATPGPPSAPRIADVESESGCCSCPSRGSDGCVDTPAAASLLQSASARAPPKERVSNVRQRYRETQRKKMRA
ncbi:putative protein kinase [Leptomonas seymouri]|uniref:non-specific serine/threonine protein kinase n=1 Tax=Leptomonas seymouri TaxID=5684 RepID=A0A0N1I4N0_LEPSE|nr:putative protein kinase [Leptomonas seymouri]|eukprot:KPI87392.1 putative protein kinase [Leptomonas seymouri]